SPVRFDDDACRFAAKHLGTDEPRCPRHLDNTFAIRSPPVVVLPGERINLVKFHYGQKRVEDIVHRMRFNYGEIAGHFADAFEPQQWMFQVVEHAHKEDDIEGSQPLPAEFIDAHLVMFSPGIQGAPGLEEGFRTPDIHGNHFSTMTFSFESV